MAVHYTFRGTYYEVGFQLGQKMSEEILGVVSDFKKSDAYVDIEKYMLTSEGNALYQQLKQTTNEHCADYVTELRGVADGAGIDYDDLFLVNVSPELVAALKITPDGSHGVKYASVFAGCTNIFLQTDDGKVYYAHTEDVGSNEVPSTAMISVHIVDVTGNVIEAWTDYIIAGICSGTGFGFNSHGVIMGHNNIYREGINPRGVPRRFMGRRLLGVRSPDEAVQKLKAGPGMATAFTFHFLQKKPDGRVDYKVCEVAADEVAVFEPRGIYHHCNVFQHTDVKCHPEESSVHRAAVLSQYVNRYQHRATVDTVIAAISDRADKKFPVYRNAEAPDYLVTGATGIYDVCGGKFDVYTDVPALSSPVFSFELPSVPS